MPHVTLTVVAGPANVGQSFVLSAPDECIVGRDASCRVLLDDARTPPQLSRRHCKLILDPPAALVRDLDSAYGTAVNGKLLGSRAAPSLVLGRLFDGDVLSVADFDLRVSTSPVLCATCQQFVPDAGPRGPDGRPVCAACLGVDLPATGVHDREHLDAVQALLQQARTGIVDLQSLAGYEIERELGRGGMGAVYLARHADTGERVALKIVLPGRPDLVARFQREAANTLAMCHPNVVTAFASGQDNGVFFYTMEHCPGGNVEQLIRQHGRLAPAAAVALIAQVLAGLDYAHHADVPHVELADGRSAPACGLVHRDLKPGNLLLTAGPEPVIKIADLGLAKAYEHSGRSGHTRSSSGMGTPLYCPRQQMANARDVGPEVDVWAAAACLYFMLTGSPPRRAHDLAIVPVRERRADLPDALADLIDAALVETPAVPTWSAARLRAELLATVGD